MITVVQKDITHLSQYILFDIKKLERNSHIPFDIFIKKENGFVIIINMGTLLCDDIYNKLLKQKQLYISSRNRSVKNLSCKNLQYYIELNIDLNTKLLHFLCKIHTKNYPHLLEEGYSEETTECLYHVAEAIVYVIKEKKDFIKNTVQYFSHEYALEIHSLHVTLYAVNLGHLLHFTHEKLLQIALAGLIHDIGVKTIDEDIIKKDSPLSAEEIDAIEQHPQRSVSIAEHNHIHNPYIIDALLHHHERYDGSGYPNNLFAKEISQYASILGICDVFDALTSDRPYRKKFTYFEALKFILKDKSMSQKFNNQYLQALLKSLV